MVGYRERLDMKEYKEVKVLKSDRRYVEGNCVPAYLLMINFGYIKLIKRDSGFDSKESQEICLKAVDDYLLYLPVYYRDTSRRKAQKIAERIYAYFQRQSFNTGKVFMTLHRWIFDLEDRGLIEIKDQNYFDLLQKIDDLYAKGLEGKYEDENKEVTKPRSIEKRYFSAMKHAKKIERIANNKELYI